MPAVAALRGVVASPHYLASLAGLEVLKRGGNAVDAAAAANAALTVVYPHMCSAGGDGFWLIFSAKEGKVHGLNATGRSPKAVSIDLFREKGMRSIPVRGLLSVTVPGAVDGWESALERFGSMRLGEVLDPAIRLAKEGFPVSEGLAAAIAKHASLLKQFRPTAKVFLRNGKPFRAGEVLVMSDLARTLSMIGEGGADVFYRGEVADQIASYSENNGGLLTRDDLAAHRSDWVEPLSTTYRGNTAYAFPPNSQGIVTLVELNLIENFDLRSMGHLSADSIHAMVEAKKIAFRDREMISDPDFVKVPAEELLSKKRAAGLAKAINMRRAARVRGKGGDGDTIFLATADEVGNVVSLIQSLYYPFGSCVIAGSTGVLLQNRGAYFSLDQKHPNRLEPGKRTLHTLSPTMLLRDGRPFLAVGNMGRDGQPQFHMQIITNIIDFGLNVQEAIEAPRWLTGREALEDPVDVLRVEGRIPEGVIAKLRKRGHKVKAVEEWSNTMGHAQGIQFSYPGGRRVITGGADPRADGLAVGW